MACAEIASHLDLTPRMVRYSLRDVARWLRVEDAYLIMQSGIGIRIDAPPLVRRALMKELATLSDYSSPTSPAERMRMAILFLLTTDQPVIIKQLEHVLGVSRTTVLRDLDRVQEWLETHNVHLMRRPHYGLKVVGAEYDLREAIASFLVASVGLVRLLAVCAGGQDMLPWSRGNESPLARAVAEFWEGLQFSFCARLVRSIEDGMGTHFSDDSHVALAVYLAVVIWRLQEGQGMHVSPEHLEKLRTHETFAVAETVAGRIEARIDVRLEEAEVAYIAMLLLAMKDDQPISFALARASTPEDIPAEVWDIVEHMLAKASAYLHPSLCVDPELSRNLAFHVVSVLDQLRFGLPPRNPFLEDVKGRYPYLFEVAKKSILILETQVGRSVPDEEIAYITMHFAAAMERIRPHGGESRKLLVICSSGLATAWLLVSRIRAEFSGVEIAAVMRARDLHRQQDLRNIDVIVSTVPIVDTGIPTVVVRPFLDEEEVTRLRSVLKAVDTPPAPGHLVLPDQVESLSLADLVTAETVRLNASANSWQEVVCQAGRLLLDIGAVEPRYIDAMLKVIVEHGPYMVAWPGIALLHALPEQGVKRLCMSLLTLRTPVLFGHAQNDPVDVVITLGAADHRSHLRALSELQDVLQNEEAVRSIRHSMLESEVVSLIASLCPGRATG